MPSPATFGFLNGPSQASVCLYGIAASYAGRRGIASAFIVSVEVQRESFYMRRLVIIPLVVIVLLVLGVLVDRSSLGDRLSVSFIGILTGVAYQLVMSEQLPRISYVTLMHGFLSLSFLTMCATVVINLVVGTLDKRGQVALGDRIDRRCRWGFPLAYFGLSSSCVAVAILFFLAIDLSAWGEHCMTSRRAELWCKSNCPNQPRRMPGRLAPFPTRRARCFWCSSSSLWAGKPMRRISGREHANTVGLNFLLAGYTYSRGGVATDPSLPLQNANIDVHSTLLAYARALDVWGRSGKFDVVLPYSWLSGSADLPVSPRSVRCPVSSTRVCDSRSTSTARQR